MSNTPIEFILDGLNTSIQMNTLGELEQLDSDLITISGDTIANIDIAKTDIKKIFRFVSDSNDMDDTDLNDIKYYVKMNNWPDNLIINPSHAIIDPSENNYGIYNDEKNMVKHDFMRHIAEHLFGTHNAVDLMTNESYLTYDMAKKGHDVSWKRIKETLDSAFNSATQEYYTNADSDASNNYTKQFLVQLINYYPERLSRLDSIMNNEYQSIPFEDGDSISFKTTIYPNPLQHNLTGVDPIPPKTYHIKIRVKDDDKVNIIKPIDTTFVRTTDYNNSYNYTDGFVEFVMPIIEDLQVSSNDTILTLVIGANTLNLTSIRLNAYDINENIITNFENLYIDISEENIPAFVNILNTTNLNQTITEYETSNNINKYKLEFVTNDDLEGQAFKTFMMTNKTNGYVLTEP